MQKGNIYIVWAVDSIRANKDKEEAINSNFRMVYFILFSNVEI